MSNKSNIFQRLKGKKGKIGKWATILATAITITAPMIDFIKAKMEEKRDKKQNDQITVLKKEILAKITIIEQEFHPETLPSDLDTIPFISAIKKFQNESLDLCVLWRLSNENIDYNKYLNNKELDKFMSVINSDIQNRIKYGNKASAIVEDMIETVKSTPVINNNALNDVNVVVPNISHYYETMEKELKLNTNYEDIKNNIETIVSNINLKQLQQSSIRRDLKQLSKQVKRLKDVESLEFDLELFDLILTTNTANSVLMRSL